MKKLLLSSLILASASAFAQSKNFEGFSASLGVATGSRTVTGAPVYTINNTLADVVLGENSKNSTDAVLGVAYGLSTGPLLTTVGIDYISGKSTTVNPLTPAGNGEIRYDIGSRVDIYVAPGFMLTNESLAYVKLGYSSFSGTSLAAGQGAVGGPGKSGMLWGLGYKQKFGQGSPFHSLLITRRAPRVPAAPVASPQRSMWTPKSSFPPCLSALAIRSKRLRC